MRRGSLRRQRPRVGAVLMLLLVVLAGCEGAFGGLDAGSAPSTTATSSVAINAPGFSGTNVTDPDALYRAHTDSYIDRSYTATSSVTVRYPNGTVRGRRTVVIRVDAESEQFRFTHRLDGRLPWAAIDGVEDAVVDAQTRHVPPSISRTVPVSQPIQGYGNTNGTYLAIDRASGVTYHRYPVDMNPTTTSAFKLNAVIDASFANLSLSSVTQDRVDGWSAYRITGSAPGDTQVSATVGSFGLLYNVTVTRPLAEQYGGGTLTYHIDYTAVGHTTVERPDWMAEFSRQQTTESTNGTTSSSIQVLSGRSENALEETAVREVALSPEYTILTVEHEGTGRIAVWLFNGSTRQRLLVNTTGQYRGTIATNVEPGDHRLHVQADGSWEITVRNGTAPPTSVTGPTLPDPNVTYAGPFPGIELRVRFQGIDRNVEYQSWFVAASGGYRSIFAIGQGPLETIRQRFRMPRVFFIGVRTTGDWVIEMTPPTR